MSDSNFKFGIPKIKPPPPPLRRVKTHFERDYDRLVNEGVRPTSGGSGSALDGIIPQVAPVSGEVIINIPEPALPSPKSRVVHKATKVRRDLRERAFVASLPKIPKVKRPHTSEPSSVHVTSGPVECGKTPVDEKRERVQDVEDTKERKKAMKEALRRETAVAEAEQMRNYLGGLNYQWVEDSDQLTFGHLFVWLREVPLCFTLMVLTCICLLASLLTGPVLYAYYEIVLMIRSVHAVLLTVVVFYILLFLIFKLFRWLFHVHVIHTYTLLNPVDSTTSDVRADLISQSDIKHDDPLLGRMNHNSYSVLVLGSQLDAFRLMKISKVRDTEMLVSLQLLTQLGVASIMALNIPVDTVWDRICNKSAAFSTINIDRYRIKNYEQVVQSTQRVAYGLYQGRMQKERYVPFPSKSAI